MTAKHNNALALIKSRQITLVVIKNVIAVLRFNQKSTVVNVGYFHKIPLNNFELPSIYHHNDTLSRKYNDFKHDKQLILFLFCVIIFP